MTKNTPEMKSVQEVLDQLIAEGLVLATVGDCEPYYLLKENYECLQS